MTDPIRLALIQGSTPGGRASASTVGARVLILGRAPEVLETWLADVGFGGAVPTRRFAWTVQINSHGAPAVSS